MEKDESPALKEIFNDARLRHIGDEIQAVFPEFDKRKFLRLARQDLAELTLMQRVRQVAQAMQETLPQDYFEALGILEKLLPRLNSAFVTLIGAEYVALYGQASFDRSMQAMREFTVFGSSEFGIRHFIAAEPVRSLRLMALWASDPNEHVRRLASEGARPRLPWSFQLKTLMADPSPLKPLLEQLKGDPSLYVRRSVANCLNDISKDNPEWMLDLVESWKGLGADVDWVVKHGLRTLVKRGDKRALAVVGAADKADISVQYFSVAPRDVLLGQRINLSAELKSLSAVPQRLVVDYAIHYVKKSGGTSKKVFKLKTFTLRAGDVLQLAKAQLIDNFTTRVHFAGKHQVELLVNGEVATTTAFELQV